MDGTLLDSNCNILESSKNILRKLKKLGKKIVIITGRSLDEADYYFDNSFVDYILANNGSVWYSVEDNEIIKKSSIDKKQLTKILSENKEFISYIWLASPTFKRLEDMDLACEIINNSDLNTHCTVNFKNIENVDLISKFKTEYNNLEFQLMQDSFSSKLWIDILPKDNNKGINLKKIAEYLNIEIDNVIAFGDGLNDVSMVEMAGIGVAMENALEQVKNVANYVTKSNDQDGIYYFLNDFYKNELGG